MSERNSEYDNTITIRKLYDGEDDTYFDIILEENKKLPKEWYDIYPFHLEWIDKVIKELKSGKGRRIAFGGFCNDPIEGQLLCCSVILKKAEFSSHLEIKNLLVFKENSNADPDNAKRYYQQDIIHYITKFAENRGYPRLVTEIPKQDRENRNLIKVFLKKDFEIAGSWIDRFSKNDQVVILSYEVNPICGLDPYDNYEISKWIVTKYLNGRIGKQEDVIVEDNNNNKSPVKSFLFYCGTTHSEGSSVKFNMPIRIIVIQENFDLINSLKNISKIQYEDKHTLNLYIFNFSHSITLRDIVLYRNENNKNKKIDTFNDFLRIFHSNELNDLLVNDKQILYRQRRFKYEEIGGILLISNPTRFDIKKYNENLKNNCRSVYIKLGAFGENISKDMPIIFAYYDKTPNGSKKHYIWGYATLSKIPHTVDFQILRDHDTFKKSKGNAGLPSDGDILFDYIDGGNDDDDLFSEKPVWELDDFNRHNIFNSTNKVILYTIKELVNIGNFSPRSYVEDIPTIKTYLNEAYKKDYIRSTFDFYLNKNEVEHILSLCNKKSHSTSLPKKVPYEFNGFKKEYIIEEASLGNASAITKVRILIFQLNTELQDWKEKNGRYYPNQPNEIHTLRDKIFSVLNLALIKNINAIVFPELSIPELLVPDVRRWAEENKNILIIGGSHYYTSSNKTISRCPVIFNDKLNYTEKIFPSPNELSSILEIDRGLENGNKIIYFTNTIIGNFFVLICSDNLKPIEIRAECLKFLPDFIIVPACQHDSNDYYTGMSDTVNHSSDIFYIYSNNKINGHTDGKSAFFGIVRQEIRDELIYNKKTDFRPKGKICELKEEENYLIVEVNIDNKNPGVKRKVGQVSNVKVEVGEI